MKDAEVVDRPLGEEEPCQAVEYRLDPGSGAFEPHQCPLQALEVGPDGHPYCDWHLAILDEGPEMGFLVSPDRVDGPFEVPDNETGQD